MEGNIDIDMETVVLTWDPSSAARSDFWREW
jgi:hypothetical protein